MGFKENLRAELQFNGMMVKELAVKTGIKKRTLDNYLSSHDTIPSADIAIKIAQALNTTVEKLFSDYNMEESQKNCEIDELISGYKKLNMDKRKAVLNLVKVM